MMLDSPFLPQYRNSICHLHTGSRNRFRRGLLLGHLHTGSGCGIVSGSSSRSRIGQRFHVRESSSVCVCLLLQDLVQSCLFGEGGDIGGHVLREMTSRGLCGPVCSSRTSERGGEGDCVKEGGGGVCVFITAGPSTERCVCLLLQDLVQSCSHGGGGGYGRTCATRDDEPRPVWTRLPITH
jgi:hypothetical protein